MSLLEDGSVRVSCSVVQLNRPPAHLASMPFAPGSYAAFEVRDFGAGMDEATAERAFDPFYSTRFRGRGLGLPAVLGIVRQHSGLLTLESEAGAGTTVTMFLPLLP